MIALLEGKIAYKEPGLVIVDCGGVGYELRVSMYTYSRISEQTTIKLHTVLIVREDAHLLYGFGTTDEKKYFQLLISISGVGPNTALTVLSSLSPEEFAHAVLGENLNLIKSIKGIGPKTAQRIILELKDKVQKTGVGLSESITKSFGVYNNAAQEALSALVMLGIAKNTAQQSIDRILKSENETLSVEEIIKKALKTP